MLEASEILREFCADVAAAYGNKSHDEIYELLAQEWPDLAITWFTAQAYVDTLDNVRDMIDRGRSRLGQNQPKRVDII